MQWWRILIGAGVGAAGALVVWHFASRHLDRQLDDGGAELLRQLGSGGAELDRRLAIAQAELQGEVLREVDRSVRPAVRNEVESTLRRYGITPTTGARIDRALAQAERLGLL